MLAIFFVGRKLAKSWDRSNSKTLDAVKVRCKTRFRRISYERFPWQVWSLLIGGGLPQNFPRSIHPFPKEWWLLDFERMKNSFSCSLVIFYDERMIQKWWKSTSKSNFDPMRWNDKAYDCHKLEIGWFPNRPKTSDDHWGVGPNFGWLLWLPCNNRKQPTTTNIQPTTNINPLRIQQPTLTKTTTNKQKIMNQKHPKKDSHPNSIPPTPPVPTASFFSFQKVPPGDAPMSFM